MRTRNGRKKEKQKEQTKKIEDFFNWNPGRKKVKTNNKELKVLSNNRKDKRELTPKRKRKKLPKRKNAPKSMLLENFKIKPAEEMNQFYTKAYLEEISSVNNSFEKENFEFLYKIFREKIKSDFEGEIENKLCNQIFYFCLYRGVSLSNNYDWAMKYKPYRSKEVRPKFQVIS